MTRIQYLVTTGILLIGLSCNTAWSAKITTDPSKSAKSAESSTQAKSDPRLLKKITYTGGGKSLSEVVADVSRLSGLPVSCGRNKNNWQVRDIPVVVCVKDMPLGTLLRAIADSTHTHFASEKTGDKISYRIYRRSVEDMKIDSFCESRHAARLKAVEWQWDALAAYGRSKQLTDIPKQTWLLGRLLGSLGEDAKKKLLNGETLQTDGSNALTSGDMNELYQLIWQEMKTGSRRESAPSPSQSDLEGAVLQVKLMDNGATGTTEIHATLSPLVYGEVWTNWGTSLSDARALEGKLKGLPPCPKQIEPPDPQTDMGNPKMVVSPGVDNPWLRTYIDVEKPKDLTAPRFSDLIIALAEAGKINIVTEDFSSHCAEPSARVEELFGKKTTAMVILRGCMYSFVGHTGYTWFINETDKLLVGWADSHNRWKWRDHHRNMPPQALLTNLKNKYEGKGLELEDLTPLMKISPDAFDEWIRNSRDLAFLDQVQSSIDPAWQLYDSLTPADKLLANSKDGLPLMKFDSAWIAGFFRAHKLQQPIISKLPKQFREREGRDKLEKDLEQKDRVTSDPKIISTMVMRVIRKPAEKRWTARRGMVAVPANLNLSSYEMVIDYKQDGETLQLPIYGPPYAFPMMSPEREAEELT